MKQIAPLALMTALFALPPLAIGNTLLLDIIAEAPISISHPKRNQSMEQVYDQYGQAKKELTAIGKPPITRWVYKKFTVYFEGNSVIKTVIHQ